MKQLILSVVLGVAIVVSVFAQSEGQSIDYSQPWHIVFFAEVNSSVVSEITQVVEAGYLPVGFEIRPGGGLVMLLVRGAMDELKGWQIAEYTDWNTLEAEITGAIQRGYIPMGISRYGDALSVLWVEAEMELAGWRIATCEDTLTERSRTINNLQAQGFTLWGMSVHEELVWMLFLNRTNREQRVGTISVFSSVATEFQSGVAEAYNQGWRPNGLGTTEDALYVCFAR